MAKTIRLRAFWDEDAKGWVAESDDVPGLITEAESVDRLIEKLKVLIPELLGCQFRRHGKGDHDIWFSPISGRSFPVDHSVRSRRTANGILKQAGLPKSLRESSPNPYAFSVSSSPAPPPAARAGCRC